MNYGKKDNPAVFSCNLALMLSAYGGFFREGFAADSITQKIWPMVNIDAWVMNGRFLAFLSGWLLDQAGINPVYHYKAFYLMFLLLVTASLTVLQMTVLPEILAEEDSLFKRCAAGCLLALVYINGLFCESFMFPECYLIFGLSHLFSALALYMYLRKGKVFPAAGLGLIAALFYQAPLITLLIVLISVEYLRMVRTGEKPWNGVRSCAGCVIYIVAVILITVRVGAAADRMRGGTLSKAVNVTDVSFMLSELWRHLLLFLKSGMGLLPPVFLPGLIAAGCIVLTGFLMMHEKNHGGRNAFLWYLLLTLVCTGLSFSIVAASGMTGVTARLLGGLYATQAMMLFVLYALSHRTPFGSKVLFVGAGYLVLQIVFCNTIMMNHYISNERDMTYARALYDQILSYEERTGLSVTKAGYTTDDVCYDSYEDVYYKFGEINTRAMNRTGWILLSVVAMEEGRTFDRVEMDAQVREEYFAGHDWTGFHPQEQIVFRDDTMYWCVY